MRFFWVMVPFLLAACAPEMPPLDTNVPMGAKYSRGENGIKVDLAWWKSFNQPELTRLETQASIDNFDIQAAIARIAQAQAQWESAQSALLPGVDTSDSASRSRSSAFDASRRARGHTNFNLGLNASYMLDFWGRNRDLSDAAQLNMQSAIYNEQVVRLSNAASLANLYFSYLAAGDRLKFIDENLVVATRVQNLLQERVAAGTGTALDLAQQESTVNNLRAARPALKLLMAQNKSAIAVELGIAVETLKLPGGTLLAARLPQIAVGLPSDLLLRRPDIASQEALLRSNYANLSAARAAFFPTIQLTGSGGFQSVALHSVLDSKNSLYSVGVGLTDPIFDNGARQGNFDQSKGRQDELLADYRKTIVSAFSDVENALAAQKFLAEQEVYQRQSLAASQQALTLSEQRLREGTIDLVTVLNTQNTLFTVQDQLVQTRLGRLQAVVSLFQALGGGWSRDQAPAAKLPADLPLANVLTPPSARAN